MEQKKDGKGGEGNWGGERVWTGGEGTDLESADPDLNLNSSQCVKNHNTVLGIFTINNFAASSFTPQLAIGHSAIKDKITGGQLHYTRK